MFGCQAVSSSAKPLQAAHLLSALKRVKSLRKNNLKLYCLGPLQFSDHLVVHYSLGNLHTLVSVSRESSSARTVSRLGLLVNPIPVIGYSSFTLLFTKQYHSPPPLPPALIWQRSGLILKLFCTFSELLVGICEFGVNRPVILTHNSEALRNLLSTRSKEILFLVYS